MSYYLDLEQISCQSENLSNSNKAFVLGRLDDVDLEGLEGPCKVLN